MGDIIVPQLMVQVGVRIIQLMRVERHASRTSWEYIRHFWERLGAHWHLWERVHLKKLNLLGTIGENYNKRETIVTLAKAEIEGQE